MSKIAAEKWVASVLLKKGGIGIQNPPPSISKSGSKVVTSTHLKLIPLETSTDLNMQPTSRQTRLSGVMLPTKSAHTNFPEGSKMAFQTPKNPILGSILKISKNAPNHIPTYVEV